MKTNLSNLLISNKFLEYTGSYWKLLTPEFDIHLKNCLQIFEKHRLENGMIPESELEWKSLPFGSFAKDSSWKWRRQSLKTIKNLLKDKSCINTLEIGSWNGWLTKYLAEKSNFVVATDYFVCSNDGIGNIQNLAKNIIPLQCNVEEINTTFKPKSFDLIVLNHNVSHMNNPVIYLENIMPLLTKKGIIVCIGTTFFKSPKNKIKFNKTYEKSYFDKYNSNLFIQPIKGYLDLEDKKKISNLNFKIKPNYAKIVQNIYSYFNPKAPFYCFLIFKKND